MNNRSRHHQPLPYLSCQPAHPLRQSSPTPTDAGKSKVFQSFNNSTSFSIQNASKSRTFDLHSSSNQIAPENQNKAQKQVYRSWLSGKFQNGTIKLDPALNMNLNHLKNAIKLHNDTPNQTEGDQKIPWKHKRHNSKTNMTQKIVHENGYISHGNKIKMNKHYFGEKFRYALTNTQKGNHENKFFKSYVLNKYDKDEEKQEKSSMQFQATPVLRNRQDQNTLNTYFNQIQVVECFGQSFQGKRPYNQDRFVIEQNNSKPKLTSLSLQIEQPNKNQLNLKRYSLFAVFDGHGGSECAQFCKQNLNHILISNANFNLYPFRALQESIHKLEQKYMAICQGSKKADTSGSCAVVTLITQNKIYIANVGDSRALLLGNLSFTQATKDHKPEDKDQKMRIISHGGKVYKDGFVVAGEDKQNIRIFQQTRITPGNLNVSRSIGDIQIKLKKYGGLPGMVIASPDLFTFDIENMEYECLILASDGLFEGLSNEQIHEMYVQSKKQNNTKLFCKDLINKASHKSRDNITVVCVFLSKQQTKK